jgi:hypothetical protein
MIILSVTRVLEQLMSIHACQSCFSSTSIFNAEKRATDHAVARSVNAVPDSPPTLRCSFEIIYICEKLGGLRSKLR